MLRIPPDPDDGDNILEWAKRLSSVLRTLVPRDSKDVYVNERDSRGFSLALKRGRGDDSPSEPIFPFDLLGSATPLEVKVSFGLFAGSPPSNINVAFPCTDDGRTWFWIDATYSAAAKFLSCIVDYGDTVPDQPEGAPDLPPTHYFRAIGYVEAADGKITKVVNLARACIDVVAVVTDVDCESVTKAYLAVSPPPTILPPDET